MRIQIFEPFSKGLRRMTAALFRDFDLKKWLIFGFSAFLAGLAGFGGPSFNWNLGRDSSFFNNDGSSDLGQYPSEAWQWLLQNSIWFFIGAIILVLIIVLALVFLWLSSRGRFMFLYNVLEDKPEIGVPWKKFKQLANSLFVFRIILGLCYCLVSIVFFGIGAFILYSIYSAAEETSGAFWLIFAILLLGFFVYIIAVVFIEMIINDFLVPIMYKFDVMAFEGAKITMELVSKHLGSFVLYGLFSLGVGIAVILGITIIGFATCCIGFLLIMIPYIGSVILLPVAYTYRAFSVEFLEQFGDEYKLFPDPESGFESDNTVI